MRVAEGRRVEPGMASESAKGEKDKRRANSHLVEKTVFWKYVWTYSCQSARVRGVSGWKGVRGEEDEPWTASCFAAIVTIFSRTIFSRHLTM